jgi:uncharacterized HhH-GPD family protein
MVNKVVVRDAILAYYENVLKKKEQKFTSNDEADALVKSDATAFVFAVILDQGAESGRMWEIPYHMTKILGHLDVHRISRMEDGELFHVFAQLPCRPRYWKTAAKRVRNAANQIVARYQGRAGNIWNDNPKAGDLQARLDNFDGIGQKKASMATRILGMDLHKPIRDWNEMDVSVDEMIRRVFPRTGLSVTNKPTEIIEAARVLCPVFPGALDYPSWEIGRNWCKPQSPKCSSCPIGQVCPKIGVSF